MAAASPLALGMLLSLGAPTGVQAQAVNLGGVNNILADGRTKTTVEVNGSHTKVNTETVSNGTGFNSFSDFQQAAGTRVDLYVPDGAGNLVNIVRNGPVVIDGVLNSFKNGEIGGNVFFSSSQGFIVGANGTVNVGSLTVNTPTGQFLDSLISADGVVDDTAAGQLMRNAVPISHDGIISISGVVNAPDGISLYGRSVQVNGQPAQHGDVELDQRVLFESTVNTSGLNEGGALISRGGRILIVGTEDVRLRGVVDVSAETTGRGGDIEVRSGGDIEVEAGALLVADGAGPDGAGGDIILFADETLIAESGSIYSARGAGSADGGFVELSGSTAIIGAVRVNLSSESGAAGTLLFDPWDLYIGGSHSSGGSGDDYSSAPSIVSNGANVILQADNSITILAGGSINTMNASAAAGSITLEAPIITIANTAELLAGATGGFAAGDITLTATKTSDLILGLGATADITIDGGATLRGHNITLSATATAAAGIAVAVVPSASATIDLGAATIDATGTFTASATATGSGTLSNLPIGIAAADILSSVKVIGTDITAASAVLTAASSITTTITTSSLTPSSSPADGALAVSVIDSGAIVDVSGAAKLTIAGALNISANNNVVSTVSATPNQAAFGASVAVSVVEAVTSATIGGSAEVTAGSLSLEADASIDVTLEAMAAAAGGEDDEDAYAGSETASYLDKYGEYTSTPDGGSGSGNQVSVVGGLAISDLTATTTASIGAGTDVTVTGATRVSATTAAGAEMVADGSTVEAATGVGVAVGINLAKVSSTALVEKLTTGSLTMVAGTPVSGTGNVFSTEANSGAGSSNVGIAGSVSVNLIDTGSSAQIGSDANVTVTGGGSVSLAADNRTSTTAKALPKGGGAAGGKVGIGASVALNIVANRSVAEIADAAVLTGAGDASLAANGVFSVETGAESGSAGGVSITPVLALSLVSNTTTAQIGSGGVLGVSRDVLVSAAQQSSVVTKASGKAAGATAAIGAAVAIALVDDVVVATTARAVNADGSVGFIALGASFSELTAEASAVGAEPEEDDGSAPNGDVDSQVTGQLGSATTKQKKAGVGSDKQQDAAADETANGDARSASTSEGKVSVAAAIGVNIQKSHVSAEVPDDLSITSGDMLTLRAVNNTDGKVTADGSAVGGEGVPQSQVGIGAAVSVNLVSASNTARLGTASHAVGGLTVEALSLDVAKLVANSGSTDTRDDEYLASAASGAGASKVGIAASLALNLIDTESSAQIGSGANVTVTGGGSVSLAADNRTSTTAKALPTGGGATGGKVGIGASVALNIVANRSVAEIADTAVLTGADDVSLAANGVFSVETQAESGSAGGVSITPVVALSLVSNTTTARIGSGGVLGVTGDVLVSAAQQSSVVTKASGKAAGATAAIGAAVAIALVDDVVVATTDRAVNAGGSVGFSASGISSGTLVAEASASGAKGTDDEGKSEDGKTVDDNVTGQMQFGSGRQTKAGVGSDDQQTSTQKGAADENGRSAKSEEGKVSVAAAIAVNVTNATVSASVEGVDITAGGALSLASAASASGSVTSDGSAADSQVGIGVAVSVNVINKSNTALINDGTFTANGVSVAATQAGDPSDPEVDTIEAKASSGAGGSKVGIAGALALNLIKAETTARIDGTAIVDAVTGASSIAADQRLTATAEALPSGNGTSGGKVGIGASVALNLITSTSVAELADGATLNAGTGLTVSANTALSTTTKAQAGASGGIAIDAVVALAMLNTTTSARIGTGNALSMGGGTVSVAATSSGDQKAEADGAVKSGNVGVGAAAAVIIGNGSTQGALANTSVTSATLARNVTAGSVAISASSTRSYVAEATATAGGGKSDAADSDKPPAKPATSTGTLDTTQDYQKGTDKAAQNESGKPDTSKQGGKVQVAAAVGVAVSQDVVTATIAGGVGVNATGAVSVEASNTTDMATVGSGQAGSFGGTSNAQVGVGIGVALAINTSSTAATIGNGAQISQSGSVTVSATTKENASADFLDRLSARAVAGASSSKVSVAGAIAVGITLAESRASIGDGVSVVSAGDVAVSTNNTSRLGAKALAGSYTSGNAAVGASIATAYSERDLGASIGAGTSITGSAVTVQAINAKIEAAPVFPGGFTLDFENLKLDELGDQFKQMGKDALEKPLLGRSNYYAEAIGGAAAPSGVAVQGSFAVMIFDDTVSATIGESVSGTPVAPTTINATGAVTLNADNEIAARAVTGGLAVGNSVGVGVSASIIVSEGTTRATLAGNASVANPSSFEALAKAGQDVWAFGIAAGGASTTGIAGVATVITSRNRAEARVDDKASVTTAGTATISAANTFDTKSVAAGVGVGGTTGVGAGASAIVVENVTRAALGAEASLDASGSTLISATSKADALTIAAAGGVGGTVGAAVGAAVYVFSATTEALVGNLAKVGQVATSPGALSLVASDSNSLTTVSGAMGGGGTVGGGAGAAVAVIGNKVTAGIGESAKVDAADIRVEATSELTGDNIAIAAGVGGTAGLAGAAAVFSINNTTAAGIGANATVFAANNVAVLAHDAVSVSFISGSLAASGTASIGASASVAVVNTTTSATIGDNAKVTALALGDAVAYVTGFSPGLSAFSGGQDETRITAPGLSSDDPNDDLSAYAVDGSGSDGEVLTAAEARRQGLRMLALERDATKQTQSARGVIVNATAQTEVLALAIGGAASGGVSVSVSANVPVITTKTTASIGESAEINRLPGTPHATNQSVVVAAASDLYRIGVSAAISGGVVGVGGGVDTAIISPTTSATIGDNAQVRATHDVMVTANARQDFVGAAAAGAVGVGASIAGGISVFSLDSKTEAGIGAGADVLAEGNVAVLASDVTRTAMLSGALAVDLGGVGIGGAVGVNLITKRTDASIGAGAQVTALGQRDTVGVYSGNDFTATRQARGVVVLANSNESAFALSIAGAGGLFAGVSGAVTVHVLDVATTASVGDGAMINTHSGTAHAQQDVVVVARDSASVAAVDGALAVSAGGAVAGAVDIGVLKTTSAAWIGDGAAVNATNRVDVVALQNTSIDSVVVSAAGAIVGVAAGVSVYNVGDGETPENEGTEGLDDDMDGVTDYVQGQVGDGTVASLFEDSNDVRVQNTSAQVQAARDGIDVAAALSGGTGLSIPPGTSASIGNATINAGSAVSVRSRDSLGITTAAGALAGGLVGLGAGVSVVTVETTNTAQISGSGTISGGGAVAVDANSDHHYNLNSLAGSFGIAAAAQAAVALVTDNSKTRALISAASLTQVGPVSVNASSQRTATIRALGAALAGSAAVGVTYGAVNLGGSVTAYLDGVTIGSTGSRADSVSVTADSQSEADVWTTAASGGIGAAIAGSIADALATTAVSTSLKDTTIYATGLVKVRGHGSADLGTEARGFAGAGGLAVGASFSNARAAQTIATTITGSVVDAGSIQFAAASGQDVAPRVSAFASGSAGALVGVAATEANATNVTSTNALVQTSALKATGHILVAATGTSNQDAEASGIAIGIVAAGSNNSRARSTTTTTAILRDLASLEAGSLTLDATGTDTNTASAKAGSGGVVAGTASKAETASNSTTRAAADATDAASKYTLAVPHGEIMIAATHTANFGGSVDSTQASAVGASGARIAHAVNSTVDAHLGDHAVVRAADLVISAKNLTHNYYIGEPPFGLHPGATPKSNFNSDSAGWNINSGSGGLIDAPAGAVNVSITHNTNASIGKEADVHLLAQAIGMGQLDIEAYNEIISHQRAKLDSGGAVAVASTEARTNAIANASVSIGEQSDVIVDRGDIRLAAWGQADIEARSVSTTYGVAGAPSGKAYAVYNGSNAVTMAENVRLEATDGITPLDGSMPLGGTVSINAGAALDGREAALRFRTTVDLFNNTAIPIDSTPDARVVSNNTSNVLVGASDPNHPVSGALYGISSAGDITLRALGGNVTASAVGIGKNIYLEAMSETASAVSNLFGGDDITFEIHGGSTSIANSGTATIKGLIYAGLQRHKTLTISYIDTTCDILINACLAPPVDGEIGYAVSDPEEIGTTILDRLAELELLLFEYGNDPVAKGAYQSEIRFLQTKLAALGLGSFNSAGEFVASSYVAPNPAVLQAQIDEEHGKITIVTTVFASVAGTLVSVSGTDLAGGLTTARTDLASNSNTVQSAVQTFINGMPTGDAVQTAAKAAAQSEYNTRSSGIIGLITAGDTSSQTITARVADNQTQQNTITSSLATIETQRALLEQARIAGNTAGETAAAQAIDAAFLAIESALGTIETNNAIIRTQSENAKQNALDLQTEVTALRDWASGLSGAGSSFDSLATNITAIGNLVDNIAATAGSGVASGLSESLVNLSTALDTEVDKLLHVPTDPGTVGGYNTLSQYFHLLGELTGNVVGYTELLNSPAQSPTTRSILVDDASARLANVSIHADRLLGDTGSLQAPGDARIEITNNTAYTLKLGNLLIPDYDAANVRFNGVLVHNAADIDALNPTGTAPVGLFVRDGLNSSRAQVVIESAYNPDSLFFHQPGTPLANNPQVAPDIVLTSGSKIANPTGAVNITSAAGNIYIQGEIQAGSLSILAKNGDFVSSYVNGFDHVGGDPGSFNNPLNTAEAGRGIIVNGSISIAARYLNINSTIQSGIADWSLNLGANPTLTTTVATAIGREQSAVDAAIDSYRNAIIVSKNPISAIVDLGGGVTLNMGPSGLRADEAAGLMAAIKAYLDDTGPNPSPVYNVKIAGVLQPINVRDYISGGISGQLEFSLTTLQAYMGTAGATPAAAYKLVTGSDPGAIGAAYDALNNQFVVDSTRVSGGYIELYGQIINTAYVGSGDPVGRLNVLDGFGTIEVTNNTGIPVVLQALHAGEDNGGNLRGVEGRIVITDVTGVSVDAQGKPTVDIRRTTYTRDYVPGDSAGQVRALTELGALDDDGNFVLAGSATTAFGGDRSATYNPTANMRYVWTTGTDYKRVSETSYTRDSFFTISALTVASRWNDMVVIGTPTIESVRRLPDGTYLTTSKSLQPQAAINWSDSAHRTQLVSSSYPAEVDNSTLASQPYVTSTYYYADPTKITVDEGNTTKTCIGWTLCTVWEVTTHYTVTQRYTEITAHSLKADNPIGINFIGGNTGAITVASASDVVLLGNVTNAGGDVSITAGSGGAQASIVSIGPSAVVTGSNITLAATGSIGGVNYAGMPGGLPPITDAPAVAVMLTGGALTARANTGNVVISTRGNLVVDEVSTAGTLATGGKIDLVALSSISAAGPNSLIQGQRVSLSAGGSIGSMANGQLLSVNTGFTADPLHRPFGDPAVDPTLAQTPYYGLTATAGGDIGIISDIWSGNADGTMLVDKVLSIGGDVRLVSPGRILDNNPVESIDSRTYDQLVDFWESLGLLAEDQARGIDGTLNAEKQAAAVVAFERSRDQAYGQYWRIRQSQPDGGQSYDPGHVVTVSGAQHAALTSQFSANVRADNPGFTDAEVSAAVAQLVAEFETAQTQLYHELHGQVGGFTQAYDAAFSYDASAAEIAALVRGATWTERQLAFSLSAGALKTVTSTNPVIKDANVSGRTVTIEAGRGVGETVGAGTSDVGISIKADIDPRDMTLAQKVALAAAERSDLLLKVDFAGAIVDIPLGTDYADLTPLQQQALDAAASRTIPAADMTIIILSKRPLNFAAADALNVTVDKVPDGATLDLGTAHLASRGNGLLGSIDVPGETRIKVIGTIINAPSGSVVNTGNLVLEAAQGGIGAGLNPLVNPPADYPALQLGLRTGSTLTARAQNGVNIVFTGDALIDTVYSPQDVTLKAGTGSILNANNDLLINILGTQVLLDAAGTIGTGSHALNVGNNLGGAITATANGLINLFGSAGHQFMINGATSSTASVKLAASLEGIINGPVTAPGEINLAAGTRLVVSGAGSVRSHSQVIDVRAGSLKMINGATMTADIGRVVIQTDGDALVTGIESGSADLAAISITTGAAGRVFAGTDDGRAFDLKAVASGAGVYIRAGAGIGDKTQANDKWQDASTDIPGSANLVTDVPNPLRILTSAIDLQSLDGSIYLATLSEITSAYVTADLGDIYIWAAESFYGNVISASQGHVMLDVDGTVTDGDLTLELLRAKTFELNVKGRLKLDDVEVAEEAILRAGIIEANIRQVPPGPPSFRLTLTGRNGSVGTWAKVNVDAPAGLIVDDLRFVDAELGTTARQVSILSAHVPGSLWLRTPVQALLFDNRSPVPRPGNNVQMYQPSFSFTLELDDHHTTTDAYVVRYDTTAQVTNVLGGLPYDGASLVRDTIRLMNELGIEFGDALLQLLGPLSAEWEIEFDEERNVLVIGGVSYPVFFPREEAALELGSFTAASAIDARGYLQ